MIVPYETLPRRDRHPRRARPKKSRSAQTGISFFFSVSLLSFLALCIWDDDNSARRKGSAFLSNGTFNLQAKPHCVDRVRITYHPKSNISNVKRLKTPHAVIMSA